MVLQCGLADTAALPHEGVKGTLGCSSCNLERRDLEPTEPAGGLVAKTGRRTRGEIDKTRPA